LVAPPTDPALQPAHHAQSPISAVVEGDRDAQGQNQQDQQREHQRQERR